MLLTAVVLFSGGYRMAFDLNGTIRRATGLCGVPRRSIQRVPGIITCSMIRANCQQHGGKGDSLSVRLLKINTL
jgi:hypothetical protein